MSESTSSGSGGDDGVPHHLMPIAAILGTYSLVSIVNVMNRIYRRFRYTRITAEMRLKGTAPKPLKSIEFALVLGSSVLSALLYGYVTALVNNAMVDSGETYFDPYDVLGVDVGSDQSSIKTAYRNLSRRHHPDKGGDPASFHRVSLAYRSLTDDDSRENYEKYGHPDGPQTQTLSFALPDWLLHPEGATAAVLVLLYLGMFVALVLWVMRYLRKTEVKTTKAEMATSVAGADAAYLASHLRPDSTHMDVLFLIATTPENVEVSRQALEAADAMRRRKLEVRRTVEEAERRKGPAMEFDIGGDDEWANDDDDDGGGEGAEAAQRARLAEEEKRKADEQLAAATGRADDVTNVKLEGVDEGVLGQKWVEEILEKDGKWPPKNLGVIDGMTFSDGSGGVVGAMESPAVRRNLCMTMGRLNAQMLNAHPVLVAAGQKGMIDPTYFKATMEFRQRVGLLLEAALRVSMGVRSYRLARTVVESVSMFKIGTMSATDPKVLEWFRGVMERQYGADGGVPRLDFLKHDVETEGEDEIATGDLCSLKIHVRREHADAFLQQKMAMCAKQGIPPQAALQTYREGWWILVRAQLIDDDGEPVKDWKPPDVNIPRGPLLKMIEGDARRAFETEPQRDRLLTAWPFIVQNVQQKEGRIKVQFKMPPFAGKYKILVSVKSQEFLGCDQEFEIEKEVVDHATLVRKSEEEGDDEDGEDGEDGADDKDDKVDEEGDESSDEEEDELAKKTK